MLSICLIFCQFQLGIDFIKGVYLITWFLVCTSFVLPRIATDNLKLWYKCLDKKLILFSKHKTRSMFFLQWWRRNKLLWSKSKAAQWYGLQGNVFSIKNGYSHINLPECHIWLFLLWRYENGDYELSFAFIQVLDGHQEITFP